jgi:hypothetical protein
VLLEKEGRNFAFVGAIADHWGYTPKSSPGLVALAALKKFGLIEEQGSGPTRQARVSPLAEKIILDDRPDSAERLEAIREAALRPAIHAELWQKFGDSVPSDANLRYHLRVEKRFTDSAVSDFIQEFRSTIEFAKLVASDTSSAPPTDTLTQGSGADITTSRPQEALPGRQQQLVKRAVQLPLSASAWATLEAPFPLNEDAWAQMIAVLQAMKPGLTQAPNDVQEKSPEAQDKEQ